MATFGHVGLFDIFSYLYTPYLSYIKNGKYGNMASNLFSQYGVQQPICFSNTSIGPAANFWQGGGRQKTNNFQILGIYREIHNCKYFRTKFEQTH